MDSSVVEQFVVLSQDIFVSAQPLAMKITVQPILSVSRCDLFSSLFQKEMGWFVTLTRETWACLECGDYLQSLQWRRLFAGD